MCGGKYSNFRIIMTGVEKITTALMCCFASNIGCLFFMGGLALLSEEK
jgi:hypothetical protein